MHLTVVGAGVLGRVYGLRLAASGTRVTFVVRPDRTAESRPFVIEQVNGSRRRDALDSPDRAAAIPAQTGGVLVTVRFDELGGEEPAPMTGDLVRLLQAAPRVPILVLTPLLPAQQARLVAAIGGTVVPAMPGVVGYVDDRDIVRYWVPGLASTLLEDPDSSGSASPIRPFLEDLARKLTMAGLPARIERDVAGCNAASTTAFFPLVAGIDAGGSIDGVLTDKALLETVLDAAKECDTLARRLGKMASWAHLFMKFVGPFTLKPGVALARRLAPEIVQFVERHFGHKLHAQHLAMGNAILELGKEHRVEMPALLRLVSLVRAQRHDKA
jgi:2-dehydropantoate 2-reductase